MNIEPKIDAAIQESLVVHDIKYELDKDGRIKVYEFRMDTKARMGMVYTMPSSQIPNDALPYIVPNAEWVLCVFCVNNHAAIIELGINAINGEIKDYYQNIYKN